jgi:hypothetical protein
MYNNHGNRWIVDDGSYLREIAIAIASVLCCIDPKFVRL